jgi:hypothetical protein
MSEGFEYHLLAIALPLAPALRGAGAFSLDRVISADLASVAMQPGTAPQNHFRGRDARETRLMVELRTSPGRTGQRLSARVLQRFFRVMAKSLPSL